MQIQKDNVTLSYPVAGIITQDQEKELVKLIKQGQLQGYKLEYDVTTNQTMITLQGVSVELTVAE